MESPNGYAPRIYFFHSLLVGPLDAWPAQFAHAKQISLREWMFRGQCSDQPVASQHLHPNRNVVDGRSEQGDVDVTGMRAGNRCSKTGCATRSTSHHKPTR